jgi:hypothetical protein
MGGEIRHASEGRGFAVSRLLTHWAEVVGTDVADHARPTEVSYGRGGFGATLTLLIDGAHGPMIEMQRERIREKVNAIYGYNAIARLRFTQTSGVGFAESQAVFRGKKPAVRPTEPDAETLKSAQAVASDARDDALRGAIERLACNVLTRSNTEKESST